MFLLVAIAFLELAIFRVAVPLTRPPKGKPPGWQTALDYGGLFLLYFTGALATVLILARVVSALRQRRDIRTVAAHVVVGGATLVTASILVAKPGDDLRLVIEMLLAASVLALLACGFGAGRDLGAELGMVVIAAPLLLHGVAAIGGRFLWPENNFDGPGVTIPRAGVMLLCAAAVVSPYVFAPRPFARAVTRPGPILFAMAIAALGAVAARNWYRYMFKIAPDALGVELAHGKGDPRMSIYLLGVATLAWTLSACAVARAPARREIGAGLALIVLGGYRFHWAHHYLLPLLGLVIIADAVSRVRDEEAADMPLSTEVPAVSDASWSRYIGSFGQALRRVLTDVHSLTTRGEGGLVSSLVVGEKDGLNVRTRIERIDGTVVALDVVVGREIDEVRGATFSLWAIPARGHGPNPAGPPAAPLFKTADAAFDQRFKSRGSALAFNKLFDDGLRARAVATLDGWLAYWEPEGLRYRVYPGRGAPLDHPIPLSDLAADRPGSPERLVAVIEILVELAARGVKPTAFDGPTSLDAIAVGVSGVGESTDVEVEPAAEPTDVEGHAVDES